MKLTIPKDPQIAAELQAIGRQAKFAVSLGINNAGLAAQREVRQSIGQRFALRGTTSFFEKGVVFKRGTKANPAAELMIGVPGAWPGTATKRASAILARHEDGGSRESTEVVKAGRQLVPAGFFLPGPGLRSASSNPPRRLYPSSIGATIRFDGRNPGEAYYASSVKRKGRGARSQVDSYFVIPRVGIFERRSGGLGSKARPIWFFARRIRTAPRTGFEATAQATINREWQQHVRAAIAQALATAR